MDRRDDSRIRINVNSIFVLQKENTALREFEGVLFDISEGGIRIEADIEKYNDIVSNISVGDIVHFTIPDEYEMYGKDIYELVTGEAKILRKEIKDGNIIFGCCFTSYDADLQKYVSNKKTALFMKSLRSNIAK